MYTQNLRRFVFILLSLAAVVILTLVNAQAPAELRIGYQFVPNGDLIVKDLGWLEEALPDTKVTWIKFDSGGDVNSAIVAGAIDIGLAGSSPVTRGLSAPLNIPYKVAWIFDVIGTAEALVAKNSAGVSDLASLAGKKVATPFASTSHFSLLAALEDAGVDPTTVTIIDLQPPDIVAAWTRGDIDAAYVWTPFLAELRKDGTTLITSADLAAKGKVTLDLGVVSNAFIEQYPDVVRTWVEQQDRAVKLYQENPEEAAASIARQLNISPEDALSQAGELVWLDAAAQASPEYLGTPEAPGALAENLFAAAEFLKTQGRVDEVSPLETYQAGLASQFVNEVARE
jgi:taurine transport system substrate-binding protein